MPSHKMYDFDTKAHIVEVYLFTNTTLRGLNADRRISIPSIKNWCYDELVLREVSRRRNITYESIVVRRDEKVPNVKHIPLDKKVEAVEAYLFTSKSLEEVGSKQNTSIANLHRWYNDDRVLRKVAERRGITYEDVKTVRYRRLAEAPQAPKSFEFKSGVIESYLFGKGTKQNVGQSHGVHTQEISRWLDDPLILEDIAKKRGITSENIIRIRGRRERKKSLEVRSGLLETYLFSEDSSGVVAQSQGISQSTLLRWCENSEILNELSRRRKIPIEEIHTIINRKIQGREKSIKDATSFREFIETNETARIIVGMLTYGEERARAVARILVLMNPNLVVEEDVPDYLPSLGPYLGKFLRTPRTPWDIIHPVPMALINQDEFVRDTFLDLGREYVLGLLSEKPNDGDKKAALEILDTESKNELNPESVRWLYFQLFDEFNEFFELSKIVNGSKVGA